MYSSCLVTLTLLLPIYLDCVSSSVLKLETVARPERNADDGKGGISDWWEQVSTSQPKYDATTALLNEIQAQYPDLVKIYSVGKTVEDREMWVVNLRTNVQQERKLLQPPVKIVANMHGDETLGRALMLMLIVDLVKGFSENDSRVVQLLENTDVHLMPSVNPDGFEAAVEGDCSPNPSKVGRQNAHGVDLNRNFPDQFVETRNAQEPETANMIQFIDQSYFVQSLNLHGGAVVASYPYDSVSTDIEKTRSYHGSGIDSLSPDNDIFVHLAKLYADNHKTMKSPNHPECRQDTYFPPDGITNGAHWYNVRGGMQDVNYVNSNCFEITIEVSCCKYPPSSELLTEWDNNKESLYTFLEATHMGIRGIVTDSEGNAVKGAAIVVEGRNHTVHTTDKGEYWRLLVPGKYRVGVEDERIGPVEMVDVEVGPLNLENPTIVNFVGSANTRAQSSHPHKRPHRHRRPHSHRHTHSKFTPTPKIHTLNQNKRPRL